MRMTKKEELQRIMDSSVDELLRDPETREIIEKEVLPMAGAIVFWHGVLLEEEDQELLELAIESLEIITRIDIKHLIRQGLGDWECVSEKCIERGLV